MAYKRHESYDHTNNYKNRGDQYYCYKENKGIFYILPCQRYTPFYSADGTHIIHDYCNRSKHKEENRYKAGDSVKNKTYSTNNIYDQHP